MLNLFRSARNRLRPVWITLFGIVYRVFPTRNRFRYKFFDIVQFSRSCLSTSAADSLDILPDLVLNVKCFFQKFLNFLEELVELRTFSSVFVEICLSDVRLTVMYFSTASFKKQAFFTNFTPKSFFLLFAQFFTFFIDTSSLIPPKAGRAAGSGSYVPAWRSVPV